MQEINMGTTLYDMNKMLIKQEKPMSKFAINDAKTNIILPWIYNTFNNHLYYMLLCHERRDYTMFNANSAKADPREMAEILIECFANRDLKLYSIAEDNTGNALEIWSGSNDDDEVYCYYLFPYDEGVIEL